jgi:basic membrane protein A and related proteins
MLFSRRNVLLATGGIAAVSAMGTLPRRVFAADKIKVAAIYTVPVEQQWVSRIHKAANTAVERGDIEYTFSEKVANTDYERVMREYCEARRCRTSQCSTTISRMPRISRASWPAP